MNKENQLVEIDVLSLIKTVWKRKFIILLIALVAAVLALGYSLFIAKPSYQSTTRIYVVNRQQTDNNTLTNQDLQAGSYLVKDYKEIILSQDVLSTVISELKLPGTTAELSKSVSVSVPTDTRIVSITVKIVILTKLAESPTPCAKWQLKNHCCYQGFRCNNLRRGRSSKITLFSKYSPECHPRLLGRSHGDDCYCLDCRDFR